MEVERFRLIASIRSTAEQRGRPVKGSSFSVRSVQISDNRCHVMQQLTTCRPIDCMNISVIMILSTRLHEAEGILKLIVTKVFDDRKGLWREIVPRSRRSPSFIICIETSDFAHIHCCETPLPVRLRPDPLRHTEKHVFASRDSQRARLVPGPCCQRYPSPYPPQNSLTSLSSARNLRRTIDLVTPRDLLRPAPHVSKLIISSPSGSNSAAHT